MRPWLLLLPATLLAGLFLLQPAPAETVAVAPLNSPAQAGRSAAAHLGTLVAADPTAGPYAQYLSLHAVPLAERPAFMTALTFAVNSLSAGQPLFFQPTLVDGVVAYVDLRFLKIDPRQIDRLAELGSGPAPFPEPYFHLVAEKTREFGYWVDDLGNYVEPETYYGPKTWKTTRTVHAFCSDPCAPWLPADAVAALTTLTHRTAPILDARWFLANALNEPRYHEILGTGESLRSLEKLVGLDEKTLGRLRATTLRGVVLFSEVAERNRALERLPLAAQYGRGRFWTSYDFKTSIRQQDLIDDLLQEKADAQELIWSNANGLDGYLVVDANGKVLTGADPNVALDSRTRLKRKVVDTGYHCMGCHEPESGTIPVDDEVRKTALPGLGLAVDRYRKSGDVRRAELVTDRYLLTPINEVVAQDQAFYASRVLACCGQVPARVNNTLQTAIWKYLDGPVTPEAASLDTGCSPAQVAAAIRAGSTLQAVNAQPLDNHLVGLSLGRPQRRDQYEAAFGTLATALYQAGR